MDSDILTPQDLALRSFPSIALRISTVHNFWRDQSARIKKRRLFI